MFADSYQSHIIPETGLYRTYAETPGTTVICKWKDNKKAAYSLGADDGLDSQLDYMVPEILKRGFYATFWVNPGHSGNRFKRRYDDWKEAAKNGCDFGNHTYRHISVDNMEDAEYEMRECAMAIREANPSQGLQLFRYGGGSDWNVPREEIKLLMCKYGCALDRGGGATDRMYHSQAVPGGKNKTWSVTPEECSMFVSRALESGDWRMSIVHGVGPNAEYLPTDEKAYGALLDGLYENKNEIWVSSNTRIHKYMTERDGAKAARLEINENYLRIIITAGLNPYLYDYPLTVKTNVPFEWQYCDVAQGRNKIAVKSSYGYITYEALPDMGEITVTKAGTA